MRKSYKATINHWLRGCFQLMLPLSTKKKDVESIVESAKENCERAFELGIDCKERDFYKNYGWKKITPKNFPEREQVVLWYPDRKIKDKKFEPQVFIGTWPKYDDSFKGAYYIPVKNLLTLRKNRP